MSKYKKLQGVMNQQLAGKTIGSVLMPHELITITYVYVPEGGGVVVQVMRGKKRGQKADFDGIKDVLGLLYKYMGVDPDSVRFENKTITESRAEEYFDKVDDDNWVKALRKYFVGKTFKVYDLIIGGGESFEVRVLIDSVFLNQHGAYIMLYEYVDTHPLMQNHRITIEKNMEYVINMIAIKYFRKRVTLVNKNWDFLRDKVNETLKESYDIEKRRKLEKMYQHLFKGGRTISMKVLGTELNDYAFSVKASRDAHLTVSFEYLGIEHHHAYTNVNFFFDKGTIHYEGKEEPERIYTAYDYDYIITFFRKLVEKYSRVVAPGLNLRVSFKS